MPDQPKIPLATTAVILIDCCLKVVREHHDFARIMTSEQAPGLLE